MTVDNPELSLSNALGMNPTTAKEISSYIGLQEKEILGLNDLDWKNSPSDFADFTSDFSFGNIVGLRSAEKIDKWHNFLKYKGNAAFWKGVMESQFLRDGGS